MLEDQGRDDTTKNALPSVESSKKREEFSAEEFVERLLREGAATPCDETDESFRENKEQPSFYDEEKFKRGQQFYRRYIHKMFLAKLMGLLTVLAIPSISSILEYTKMSSTPLTAYKRYLATIFHMVVWYDEGFKPSSKIWKSLEEVRDKHNFASKRCCVNGLKRISQLDMSLTLFGFMGFPVSRYKILGMHQANDEDFRGFVHVWKVIGHMMGISERFNICRDSAEETRAICDVLIAKVFRPHVLQDKTTFAELAKPLINGMWCMAPVIGYKFVMVLLYELLNPPEENVWESPEFQARYQSLTSFEKFGFWFLRVDVYLYRFVPFRYYQNAMMHMTFWFMHNFPFLAIYKFGMKDSYVNIIADSGRHSKSG